MTADEIIWPRKVAIQVRHEGCMALGLPAEEVRVELDLTVYQQHDRGAYVDQVCEALVSSFSALWGMACSSTVVFNLDHPETMVLAPW